MTGSNQTRVSKWLHSPAENWYLLVFAGVILSLLVTRTLTILSLPAGAAEINPVSAELISSGVSTWAAATGIGVAGLAYVLFRYEPSGAWDRRAISSLAVVVFALNAGNAAWDLTNFLGSAPLAEISEWLLHSAAYRGEVLAAFVVVLAAAALPAVKWRAVAGAANRSAPSLRTTASIAFSLIVVTSVFTGVITFSTGEASAASGDASIVYSDQATNELVGLDGSGTEQWRADGLTSYEEVVVAGGVAVAYNSSDIVAVDLADGSETWSVNYGSTVDSKQEYSVISAEKDLVALADGSGSSIAYDLQTGNQEWTGSHDRFMGYSEESGMLIGQDDYSTTGVDEIDPADGSISTTDKWSLASNYYNIGPADIDNGVLVYTEQDGSSNNYLTAFDLSESSELWSKQDDPWTMNVRGDRVVHRSSGAIEVRDLQDGSSLMVKGSGFQEVSLADDGKVALGAGKQSQSDSGAKAYTVSNGNEVFTTATSNGATRIGGSASTGAIPSVSGTVEDQSGTPVPNATVEIWAVNHTSVSDSGVSDVQAEADDLLDQAEDPLPDKFEQQGADWDVKADYEDSDSEELYPLVHHQSAWDHSTSYPFDEIARWGGGELSEPTVQVVPGEQYEISLWDVGKDSEGSGLVYTDPYDQQLPGASDSGKIHVERIGPGGDVVSEYITSTEENYVSKNGLGQVKKKHETATVTFDKGVYRISAENSTASYYVIAGSVDGVARTIEEDLRDKADSLTKRAQYLQDQQNQGNFSRKVVQADADGSFSADLQTGYKTVAIQAYSGNGLLDGESNPSLKDLRDQVESQDYNGTVYLPTEPERVSPSKSGIVVNVEKTMNPSYEDIGDVIDRWDRIKELLKNEQFAEIADLFGGEPSESVSQDALKDRYNATMSLIDESPLQSEFEDLAEENNVSTDIDVTQPRTTLENQIGIAEQVIAEQPAETETGDGGWLDDPEDIKIEHGENGTVTVTLPTDRDISREDVLITVENARNGTVDTIPTENITVDHNLIGEDEITADVNLTDDIAGKIEVVAVDDSGNVVRDRETVVNPGFEGDIPGIESVSVSSMRPAAGELVTVSVNGDDRFKSLDAVTVYSPDGTEETLTVSGGSANFTADSAGTHTVQMDLKSTSGDVVTETVRVKAVEPGDSAPMPPAVHAESGPTGHYAIAAEGVDSAKIETDGGGSKVAVTARFTNGDVPDNELHVHGLENPYDLQQYSVRIVDSAGSQISQSVRVSIHTTSLSEDAHVRINGEATPIGGESDAGEVVASDNGHVIRSVAENGDVRVEADTDPGWTDEFWWWFKVNAPAFPVLSVTVAGLADPFSLVPVETAQTAFSAVAVPTGVMHQ